MHIFFRILSIMAYTSLTQAQSFVPGQSYWSENGYIEYIAGNFPLILSAPHGGYLTPDSIPDRNCTGCSYLRDGYTLELSRRVGLSVYQLAGCYPHVIINHLHRKKLDANRDILEAADSNAMAELAWMAYHAFLDSARHQVNTRWGKGLYIDVHGHGHEIQRMELGYLLSKATLQASDSILNTNSYIAQSSIRNLATTNLNELTHADLLHGEYSLGTGLEQRGYPAVPSETDLFPDDDEPYFNGGYNTARYGSRGGGTIDGIQIECNGQGVRDNLVNVTRFADTLSVALLSYLKTHYFGGSPLEWCAVSNVPETETFINPIEIFPNPNTGRFFVRDLNSNQAKSIDIYGFQGNLLEKILLLPNETSEINLQHPSGVLWLKITQQDGISVVKTIIINGEKD